MASSSARIFMEKADQCRRLARTATESILRAALEQLAEEYEKQAVGQNSPPAEQP